MYQQLFLWALELILLMKILQNKQIHQNNNYQREGFTGENVGTLEGGALVPSGMANNSCRREEGSPSLKQRSCGKKSQ